MTFLRANKQVAWQVANYLRETQTITPGGGNDPYVLTKAEKEDVVKLFMIPKYSSSQQWQQDAIDDTRVRPCVQNVLTNIKNLTSSANSGLGGIVKNIMNTLNAGTGENLYDVVIGESTTGGDAAITFPPNTPYNPDPTGAGHNIPSL